MFKTQLLIIVFYLLMPAVFAQKLLDQKLTIHIQNLNLPEALEQIEKAGNFHFSYQSNIFKQQQAINLQAHNKSVLYILNHLLDGAYYYTEKRNYIIIHSGTQKKFTISGYVFNTQSGAPLQEVSIYEEQLLASTITDNNGFFTLELKNKKKLNQLSLIFKKEHYTQEALTVHAGYDQEIQQYIAPTKEIYLNDVVINAEKQHDFKSLFLDYKLKIQEMNLGHFFAHQPFQASLWPGLGTKGLMGARLSNNISFNVLGGYTAGLNGFEIGSLFNCVSGDVAYTQIAGVFNDNAANTKGVQIAGIYNKVAQSFKGVQIAGVSNKVKQEMHGVQIAGILNKNNQSIKGVQIAGCVNHSFDSTDGVQISGFVNINNKVSKGLQIAGFANINQEDNATFQVAGFSNTSLKRSAGVQLAGAVNTASKMKGVQIALLNRADTMQGFGLGLINFYKNGILNLEYLYEPWSPYQLALLSGMPYFYNSIGAGYQNTGSANVYAAIAGIGSSLKLSKHVGIALEAQSYFYNIGQHYNFPMLVKLKSKLAYTPFKKVSIFIAPTLNMTTASTLQALNYTLSEKYVLNENFMGSKNQHLFLAWQWGLSLSLK